MKNPKWLIWQLSEAGNMPHHFEKQILRMSLKTASTSIPQLQYRFSKVFELHVPSNKRKNLVFQMLAAMYHKGDHGQYCYTLK